MWVPHLLDRHAKSLQGTRLCSTRKTQFSVQDRLLKLPAVLPGCVHFKLAHPAGKAVFAEVEVFVVDFVIELVSLPEFLWLGS